MNKNISIQDHLESIFQYVQRAVTAGDDGLVLKTTRNAKGDIVKWFDLAAHEAVSAYLKEHFPYSTVLLSEEDSRREFGTGQFEFTVVLDPIDGSDNFARGMAPVSMAVALIPHSCPISVESVQYSSAVISCEMNHCSVGETLANVLSLARGVRSLGCATQAITLVASSSIDAHLDLRNRLTPENFLAPSLILTEAGGIISGPDGEPIPEISDLTQRFSIIACGSQELHAVLIQQLKGGTVCT